MAKSTQDTKLHTKLDTKLHTKLDTNLHTIQEENNRDWNKDWEWTNEALPYRIAFLSFHWRNNLHELDDQTILDILGTHGTHSIHLRRFKALAKKELLKRVVDYHLPLMHNICDTLDVTI